MNKKELEQKIVELDQKLQALGDLSVLVQNATNQKQTMDTLIAGVQAQKANIDALPQKKEEFDKTIFHCSDNAVNSLSNQEYIFGVAEELLFLPVKVAFDYDPATQLLVLVD